MNTSAARNLDDAVLSSLVSALLQESNPATQKSSIDLSAFLNKLAGEAGSSLAAIVPSIEVSVSGVQYCRLSEFAASQHPSMFVLAQQDEGRDIILFRFSAEAGDWWVASALGGVPARKPGDLHPSSPIEVRVGRVAVDLTLGALVRVLSGFVSDLTFHECRTSAIVEDLPNFADDFAGYSISIGLVPASEKICISFFVSEALATDWSKKTAQISEGDSVAQGKEVDNGWTEHFENQFSTVSVSIEAVLTAELVELENVLTWAPGRIVELGVTADSLLRFVSNDVPLFTGRLGRIDDQLCVQVQDAIEPSTSIDEPAAWDRDE